MLPILISVSVTPGPYCFSPATAPVVIPNAGNSISNAARAAAESDFIFTLPLMNSPPAHHSSRSIRPSYGKEVIMLRNRLGTA